MRSNDKLSEMLKSNINNIIFNNFEQLDFNNYSQIIKNITSQNNLSDKKIEYQQPDDINRECVEFNVLDDIDESKYIVYVNEYRIRDRISDISSTTNIDEKRQITLELLYDIVSDSYVASNQYKNRTSKDIEQNIIGINNLVSDKIKNKVTYLQRKDALDKLRFNIEETLTDLNDNNRKYIENSLGNYEQKEIIKACVNEMEEYIAKVDELSNLYKMYPNEEKSSILKRMTNDYKKRIEDIGKYMDSDKEEYEFSQDGDKITNITRNLAGNMEINYKKVDELKQNYTGNIEKYEMLNEDIIFAKKVLNSNVTYFDIESGDVPDKIKKLYENIQ